MKKLVIVACCSVVLFLSSILLQAETSPPDSSKNVEEQQAEQVHGPEEMLKSLLELQANLQEEISLSKKRVKGSTSDAEKADLEEEIAQLDKQLSETSSDFERIATGVEPAMFLEKKPQPFSWKDEMATLLEPAVKELKRFTEKARKKTDLKENIEELTLLTTAAGAAVIHLNLLVEEAEDKAVKKQIQALEPEWINVEKRVRNKLELAQRELSQLEKQEGSLVESSQESLRSFFKARGLYLIIAVLTFVVILVSFRLLYRLVVALSVRVVKGKDEQPFQVRLLYIMFQVLSVIFAVVGLFFVLYLAEDWFLLSMAIVFFLGLAWTIRQGLPRLWQQGRLMLNIGSVRENERVILHGVPWKIVSINVFSKLVNPSLDVELRVPIEDLIGLASRPWNPEESWFPCKKGDWVVINGASRAKVVSLSHEQIEVVERGGRRITYPTDVFLGSSPANLSRNFRLRVPFGVSYDLQDKVTSEIPAIMLDYLNQRMEEEGYMKNCLNLQVEFYQAGASSLDLLVLGDFEGKVADISKRIERAIQKWCVECCTKNTWEIPFPQLTIHKPAGDQQ